MAAFERSLRTLRVPAGTDVAVGVIGNKALIGVGLDGGRPWRFEHVLHGRPAVAGSVVVGAGGGEIFALDAKTGALLWSRSTGGRIRGAGDDGKTTVVSLLPTVGFGSLVLAVARDGSVVRQLEEDAAIGVPAVAGDTVFFPWGGRFLSVYDLPSGDEKARIAFAEPVSRAFALGGAVFAGESSFTRIDESAHLAARGQASTATLPTPLDGALGRVRWTRPGTDWVTRMAETQDKIAMYARPRASGAPGIDQERFAATYFRVALGFDAKTGALSWAYPSEADFLGGAAYRGGFALCDATGDVVLLDASTGGVARHVALGQAVDACIVQADALAVPPAPRAAPLAAQVARILQIPAPELAPIQRVLRDSG
jgi:outer membrane protein assembly factor BamB